MAKKIFKGVGSALGLKKKKVVNSAPEPEPGKPIVKPLAAGDPILNRRRNRPQASLLSGIGTTDRMGG